MWEAAWTQVFLPSFPLFPDDTPVAAAKNMPGDSADLFGDGAAEDGSAANGRLWRTVIIGEQEHRIDLHMIRPYMRVVTHGGEDLVLRAHQTQSLLLCRGRSPMGGHGRNVCCSRHPEVSKRVAGTLSQRQRDVGCVDPRTELLPVRSSAGQDSPV